MQPISTSPHLLVLPGHKSRHEEVKRRAQGRRGEKTAADVHGVEVVSGPVPDAAQPPRVATVEDDFSGKRRALRSTQSNGKAMFLCSENQRDW